MKDGYWWLLCSSKHCMSPSLSLTRKCGNWNLGILCRIHRTSGRMWGRRILPQIEHPPSSSGKGYLKYLTRFQLNHFNRQLLHLCHQREKSCTSKAFDQRLVLVDEITFKEFCEKLSRNPMIEESAFVWDGCGGGGGWFVAAAVGELVNNQLPIGRPGWPMGHTETGIRFSEGEHALERLTAATSNLLDAGASK